MFTLEFICKRSAKLKEIGSNRKVKMKINLSAEKAKSRWFVSSGDIYFVFEFFVCFSSLQLDEVHANGIKLDHSSVVFCCLRPKIR